MSNEEIPEHCPHYCEIKEVNVKGKVLYRCSTCGEWETEGEPDE